MSFYYGTPESWNFGKILTILMMLNLTSTSFPNLNVDSLLLNLNLLINSMFQKKLRSLFGSYELHSLLLFFLFMTGFWLSNQIDFFFFYFSIFCFSYSTKHVKIRSIFCFSKIYYLMEWSNYKIPILLIGKSQSLTFRQLSGYDILLKVNFGIYLDG